MQLVTGFDNVYQCYQKHHNH